MKNIIKNIGALLSAIFLISACSADEINLSGREFKLLAAPENAEITIGFEKDNNAFFGQAPINRYFGSYVINEDNITFNPAGATMMAGPENLMKTESDYLQFLGTVKKYKLEDNKLYLIGDKVLEFEETK